MPPADFSELLKAYALRTPDIHALENLAKDASKTGLWQT